jgi:aspartyl-tRNA(Asn)/glutamyl-tRNA(Gln) amidotransferase subunit A
VHGFNSLRAEAALEDARQAEQDIVHSKWLGPLHGIPIGIKDLIDVAGLTTTAQAEHRRDAVAATDAGVVASLKRAGAVILGKQATHEYAVGGTELDGPWPPTRNPWNLDLDPLGSSSGSAASVAAGLCAGSVGSDTAGSIRDPAAWCGVAGLKPTDRLVSRVGLLPLSRSMDCVGPIAWTVEDCALMLSGMISDSPDDRTVPGFHAPDFSGLEDGVQGLRVGAVLHFYEDDADVDPEVLGAMSTTLATLTRLGALVTAVQIGDFDHYCSTARRISWPEEFAEHGEELVAHEARFTAVSRSRLQAGRDVPAFEYIRAQRERAKLTSKLAEVMRDVDLLILPTLKKPAQVLGFEHTPLGEIELSLTRPFNLTGNPALSLCNGYTTQGLPLAAQIVGRHFEDELVLRAGHALERALGTRSRRPVLNVD